MVAADTQSIKGLRQWLCWRTEERGGKPTKIPYSPLTGSRASSTDSDTWASYFEAVKACKEQGYDGIGFVFTEEDDLAGVDLDGCFNPDTGEIEGWAQEIIDELDSYTEMSPSGTGVHVLVRGKLPEGRNRKGRFEAYDRGRYFTVTGNHLPFTPRSIESRQEQLERVVLRVLGKQESTNDHEVPDLDLRFVRELSDEEIIEKAGAADNGEKFRRLWAGDTSTYASASEAEQALCSLLAFWTGPDPGRIDALFRQSGLMRGKWERKDYWERTISKALEGRTEFYQPTRTVPINMEGTNTTNATNTYFGKDSNESVELPEAPPFPVDALPKSCQRFVKEAAVSIGCAPDLVAVPLLGLLSAAIGNSRQVQLKRGWKESAALFMVVVAEPGAKKTPAQKVALAPLWKAQKDLKKEYQAEHEAFEEELRHWEAERKAAAQEGEPAPPRPKEPVLKSVVVDDVTVERLAEILDENPRGVTSAQDELSGWVLSMNQYKAGGKGADRQFWLRVWSNAPVKVDRKSKVPAIISEPWVSVIGSIQPEILPGLSIGRNDGMMDRFLYSYPEAQHIRHTDEEISAAAEISVLELYEKLADLQMPESDGEPFPGIVPMAKEAWEVFKELADELSEEAHALGFPRRLRGVWGKLEAYLARISLILALCRVVEADEKEEVEPQDVLAAWVLMNYFKAHARRVFSELHGPDPMDSLALALAEFLKEEGDGKWEGTATELWDALTERHGEGLPGSSGKLVAKVLAITGRSKAMQAEKGWRGKNKVLRLQLLKRGVGSVGSVGEKVPATNPTNASFEDSAEELATVTREPSTTPPLSASDQWEEV